MLTWTASTSKVGDFLAYPSLTPPMTNCSSTERVAVCFAVVEQRRNPELRGQPTAVVQYNEWKGGGLIAVSYEARGFGVKRPVPFVHRQIASLVSLELADCWS
jgi:hypothetical protein